MKRTGFRKLVVITVIGVFLAMSILPNIAIVHAANTAINVSGTLYELDEKSKYDFSGAPGSSISSSGSQYGQFSITGNLTSISSVNGFTSYEATNGPVSFSYNPNGTLLTASEMNWHVVEDDSKEAFGESLGGKILKGALVLQSSKDGVNWITDYTKTNIAGDSSFNTFFETKEIQLINGCYYRVIVVYETERKLADTYIGPVAQHHYENKKNVEVYQFYLQDNTASRIAAGAHPNTKKVVGDITNTVNTGKDNGYSGNNSITSNDPHYGWKLGEFSLQGFTNTADYQGEEYFLKNYGDVITLNFTLLQNDLNCLDGKTNLSISSDKNGSDQGFQVNQTDFKHGTLIIRFTDFQGKKSDPIIYTDFLAAYARTGADTRVQLFEEGDYEVALDYEIKNSTGIDSYTNYRMFFTFKIRNGNNMAYAFDNGSITRQLNDGDWTANGFTIDMANSHYLTVTVDKYTVVDGAGGKKFDLAASRTASDGNSYNETGMYVVTVSNRYQPNGDISKTFYVGDDPYIRTIVLTGKSLDEIVNLIRYTDYDISDYLSALSASNKSLDDIVALVNQGYTIGDSGELIAPPEAEVVELPEEIDIPDENTNSEMSDTVVEEQTDNGENVETVAESVEGSSEENIVIDDDSEKKKSNPAPIIVLIAVLASAGCVWFAKSRKTQLNDNKDQVNAESSQKSPNNTSENITEDEVTAGNSENADQPDNKEGES